MRKLSELRVQRYGSEPAALPPATPEAITTLALLLSHRSVRTFQDQPLSEGTLATLLTAAQSAASSSNLQAFSVVAVRDTARKARLAE